MQQRYRVGRAVICGLALWAGAALAAGNEPSAGECFKAGFEANNADAVAACYAEDAIIWFPGGPAAKGRAAIREGFAHFFGGYTVKGIEMTEIGQEGVGDARVAWGTYVIRTADKASGAESSTSGRYTDVQKKIDGRWLYVVDHPSDDPPASKATPEAAGTPKP
ncbi:nuclear transport factor 2 family protein [Pseudoxanthomonas sp. NC8]|nr:nuclear transport factor 2 family protein [Pseudoxanthomonas sp. NC8]